MLSKQFLKTRPVCKVRFRIPSDVANGAKSAHLMGEFNEWQPIEPMKRHKDGSFSVTVDLPTGRSYQYRFLLDGQVWVSDAEADCFAHSEFGNCRNSVVEC